MRLRNSSPARSWLESVLSRFGRPRGWARYRITLESVCIGCVSFVMLLALMPRNLNLFDEGIVLSDAMRVLNGDLVHRDFYSLYGPAQYYVVGILLRLFGDGFLAARVYDITVRAISISIIFAMARSYGAIIPASIAAASAASFLLATGFYLYPVIPCIPLVLISSWLIGSQNSAGPNYNALLLAGVLAGFAGLLRYDVGFFVVLSSLLSLACTSSLTHRPAQRVRHILMTWAAVLAGAAIAALPWITVYLTVGSIVDLKADVFDYPLKYYAAMRSLPFPDAYELVHDPRTLGVYLPIGAAAMAVFEVGLYFRKRRRSNLQSASSLPAPIVIVLGVAAVIMFLKTTVRVHWSLMVLGIAPALVVFSVVAPLYWSRGSYVRVAAFLVFLLELTPALFCVEEFFIDHRYHPFELFGPWFAGRAGLVHGMKGPSCDARPISETALVSSEYLAVTSYVAAHSYPSERILVMSGRSDKVYLNAPGLYYVSNRLPETHWHEFDPGLQTRRDIQKRMIGELLTNRPRWIIRDATWDNVQEPNGSAQSSGVTLLDDYINANYHRVYSSGQVSALLHNGDTAGPVVEDRCEPPQ